MRHVAIPALLLCLLLTGEARPQSSPRLRAMGDFVVAMPDSERGLNPYDISGNPAWLLRDEPRDWLRIQPSYADTRGEYRRRFDPHEIGVYGAGSDGVRTLGESGTFRGGVTYMVDRRLGVYRSVKRDPYAGEAFFLNDTTTGDVTFNGPSVAFMYAYELFPHVILGASIDYTILDGLKYRYSNTKTLWRDIQGTLGITVDPADGLVLGAIYSPGNSQERIEAKSDDLLDVELIHFRGETYSVRQRSGTVNHKLKTATHEFGAHAYWTPSPGTTIGVDGRYGIGRKEILHSRESDKDAEDGFESSDHLRARVIAQSTVLDRVVAGGFAGYERVKDWSRHTPRDLLLWEWRSRTLFAGAGFSGTFADGQLLAGAEYEIGRAVMDSAKYIDDRFLSLTPITHTLRFGMEIRPLASLALRGGWSFAAADRDLMLGVGRVETQTFTAGLSYALAQTAGLDALLEARRARAGSLTRTTIGIELRLTLGWM